MNPRFSDPPEAVNELVVFLLNRRETLLNTWRTVCEVDPELAKISVLSREEFVNIIPAILETLEQLLQGIKPETSPSRSAPPPNIRYPTMTFRNKTRAQNRKKEKVWACKL